MIVFEYLCKISLKNFKKLVKLIKISLAHCLQGCYPFDIIVALVILKTLLKNILNQYFFLIIMIY